MELPRVERDKEKELIARAQAGDRGAFGALVREHGDEVYTLARRLVGDPHLAADIAQEALIRAWRALPHFRGTPLYRHGCIGSPSTPPGPSADEPAGTADYPSTTSWRSLLRRGPITRKRRAKCSSSAAGCVAPSTHCRSHNVRSSSSRTSTTGLMPRSPRPWGSRCLQPRCVSIGHGHVWPVS